MSKIRGRGFPPEVSYGHGGGTPPSTKCARRGNGRIIMNVCGCGSMVEHELPKLGTGVRFSSPAPNLHSANLIPKMLCIFGTLTILSALSGCGTAPKTYMTDTQTIGGIYHYVKSGETLWCISKMYGVDMNSILNANHITDASDIERGQRLLIPGSSRRERAEEQKIFASCKDFFVWPVRGTVLSSYGSKLDRTRNKGIDIRAEEGSSVRASRAGKVVFCDEWLKGFGKTVILDHGDSFQTVYAYNSTILVNIGDAVEQNTVIARVGRGGRAKEPSLHFEVRRDGESQNPFYYLSR